MGSESDCNNYYSNLGGSALMPSYYQNSDSQLASEPSTGSNLTDLSSLSNEQIGRSIREPFLLTSSRNTNERHRCFGHQAHHQIPPTQVLLITK